MRFLKLLLAPIFVFSLAACGSLTDTADSTTDTPTPTNTDNSTNTETDTSAATEPYSITYSAAMELEGKSMFTINVKDKATGTAVADITPTFTATMTMTSGSHSTPVKGCSATNSSGDSTCTIYYVMASKMANGSSTGTWALKVTVGNQEATFNPDVMMATGDTAKAILKNNEDKIAGMTGDPETRKLFLFKESLMGTTGNHTFKLFLATRESMMMHPAVATGSKLKNETGTEWTVDPIVIEISTDNETTWSAMTEDGDGYFSKTEIADLVDGTTGNIKLKLTINGNAYTTDGMAVIAGINDSCSFAATPAMAHAH